MSTSKLEPMGSGLGVLQLIIEDERLWISTLAISEISNKPHKNVMRDVRITIIDKKKELIKNLAELKFESSTKDILKYNDLG